MPLLPSLPALVGLVLPVDCAGCGAPDEALCAACRTALGAPPRVVRAPGVVAPVVAGPDYAGRVARLVVAWKDRGRADLTPVLGRALAGVLLTALDTGWSDPGFGTGPGPPPVVVPVPTSRAARRRRGEDLVGRLARHAGREAGLSVVAALAVRRRVADQAALGVADRATNVSGAFAVRPRAARLVAGRAVLVVDDVVTTGATLAEATRALRASGALVRAGAAIAATPRHGRLPPTATLH